MKKIFQFAFLVLISYSLFILPSCHCKQKTACAHPPAAVEVKKDFEKEGYAKASVIHFELDGCNYLLQLSDEKKIEPADGLSPEFQKDKLAVWVKYTVKKDGVSICMAGQIVEISDIQIRK